MSLEALQKLLQKRLDVLQVELGAVMQGRHETLKAKLDAMHIADMLAGARMELQLLARHLELPVESSIEVARSDADDALYPSSETYERQVRHARGLCGCPQSKKVC